MCSRRTPAASSARRAGSSWPASTSLALAWWPVGRRREVGLARPRSETPATWGGPPAEGASALCRHARRRRSVIEFGNDLSRFVRRAARLGVAMPIISSGNFGEAGILAPVHVLLVEDDEDGREYFSYVL